VWACFFHVAIFAFAADKTVGLIASDVKLSMSVVEQSRNLCSCHDSRFLLNAAYVANLNPKHADVLHAAKVICVDIFPSMYVFWRRDKPQKNHLIHQSFRELIAIGSRRRQSCRFESIGELNVPLDP
jgi:hypothetical protein